MDQTGCSSDSPVQFPLVIWNDETSCREGEGGGGAFLKEGSRNPFPRAEAAGRFAFA